MRLARDHRRDARATAPVMHCFDLHIHEVHEQEPADMRTAANTRRSIVEAPRIGAEQRHEFLCRAGLHTWIDHQKMRRKAGNGDAFEIGHGIIGHARDHGRHGGERAIDQQRIAIGRGAGRSFGPDHTAGAGAVFDNHGLAQDLTDGLGKDAAHNIIGTARRGGHDQANGARGAPGALRAQDIGGQTCR